MSRRKKDPTAWRATSEGVLGYQQARAEAQAAADADGADRGLEANDLFRTWRTWRLPARRFRMGHELRCEVVSCQDLSKCQPGHGPGGGA